MNVRNFRGETALHHAARNEFQKIVELLIVAGADPTVYDNDQNRPIDLVSTDDMATQITLKRAMSDREAIVSELMEIHARGFSSSNKSLNGRNHLSCASFGSLCAPIGRSSSSVFDDTDFIQQLASRNRVNMPDQLSLLGTQKRNSVPHLYKQGSHTSFNSAMFAGYNAESDTSFISEAMSEPIHSVLAPKAVRRKTSSQKIVRKPDVHREIFKQSKSPSQNCGVILQSGDRVNSKRSSTSSVEKVMARITSTSSNPHHSTSTSSIKSDSGSEVFDAGSTSTIRDDTHIASKESYNEEFDEEHYNEQTVFQREMGPEIIRLPNKPCSAETSPLRIIPSLSEIQHIENKHISDSDDTFFDDSFDTEVSEAPVPSENVYMNVVTAGNSDNCLGTLDRKEQALLLEQAPQLKNWLSDQATLMNNFAQQTQLEARKGNLDSNGQLLPPSPAKRSVDEEVVNKIVLPPVPTSPSMDSVIKSLQRKHTLNDLNKPPKHTVPVPIPRPRRLKYNHELDSNVSDSSFSASETNNMSLESDGSMFWDDTGTNMIVRPPVEEISVENVLNCSRSSDGSSTTVSDSVPISGHEVATLFDPFYMKKMQRVSPTQKYYSLTNADNRLSTHLTQSVVESIVNEYDFMSKIGKVETADSRNLSDQVNHTLSDAEKFRDNIFGHKLNGEDMENDVSEQPMTSPPGKRKGLCDSRPELNKQYMMDYEDVPAKQNRKVTIGQDHIFQGPHKVPKDHDHRVVTFNNRGKNKVSIIGGNSEGIFVQYIEQGSDAVFAGLMEGDQILEINGRSTKNKTKEEVTMVLLTLTEVVSMVVRLKRDRYEGIVHNGGMGDSFFVKANFNYDAIQDGEISFNNGDILSIRDTMPDGKVGCWRALKTNARPDEDQHGLIPNDGRGEQIALTQKKVRELSKGDMNRRGFFRRSLRRSRSTQSINRVGKSIKRSKSVDRIAADNISITSIAAGTLKAYERVEQKPHGLMRPVVLMGVFCEAVRDKLIAESPGRYEKPDGIVNLPENADDTSTNRDVDLSPVENVISRRHHCLMLASPRAVQFIRAANMHPIVIYLSPGSKSLVKQIRNKLDPDLQKRSAFMYEEAVHFGKMHSELFSATVTYTSDDSWYTLLKDTIGRMQNQTVWQPNTPSEPDDTDSFSDFTPEESILPQHHSIHSPLPHIPSSNIPEGVHILNKHAHNNNYINHHQCQDSLDSGSLSSQDYTYNRPLCSPTPSLNSMGQPKSILKHSSPSSCSSQQEKQPDMIRVRTHQQKIAAQSTTRAMPIHRGPTRPSQAQQARVQPTVHQRQSMPSARKVAAVKPRQQVRNAIIV